MTTIKQNTMTLDEFLGLPEEKPALEYGHGRVTQKLPPEIWHSTLQLAMAKLIDSFARPRKLGAVFTELRWTLATASRVPDIIVYRWERLPRGERGRLRRGAVTDPPDIAIEIVSPGQSVNAQLSRCEEFVAAGVVIALLVDPDDESVVVVRRDRTLHAVRGAERIDLDEVLPGFELTAEQLFGQLLFE